MLFEHDIPELKGPLVFPGQIVNALIGPQCPSYAGQALLTSFVRFVEAAAWQYRNARASAVTFIERRRGGVNFYDFFEASGGFEACIGYMHRATRCMREIRKRPETAVVSGALFPQRPSFMRGSIVNRLTDVRSAIQHSYEQVFSGKIGERSAFMLGLAGIERPTPEKSNPSQTTKTWDRVEIGPHHVTFAELSTWITEMGVSAQAIADYRP